MATHCPASISRSVTKFRSHRDEACVLVADPVRRRHAARIEHELGRVARPPAHLLELLRDREARRPALDDQERDPTVTLAAGAHRHRHQVRSRPRGDERLGSIDDVGVAVQPGARSERGHVAPAAGLGDRQCRDLLAAEHRLDEPRLLLVAAESDDRRQRDAVAADAHAGAHGATGQHQLLGRDQHVPQVAPRAA